MRRLVDRLVVRVALAAVALLFVMPGAARAADKGNGDPYIKVDEPAFPGPVSPRDAVRIWLETFYVPETDAGDAEISLVRPELRIRNQLPIDSGVSLQLTAGFGTSHYDVDGAAGLFQDCPGCPIPGDFYAASLGLQGGYRLNRGQGYLWRQGEKWALLAAAFGRARWEDGAFGQSVTGGGSVGLGYEIEDRLQLALGVRVESSIDDDGVSVGPMGHFRWTINEHWRLRHRGVGLQLEYRPTKRLELFVTGYRSSDRFRLDDRNGAPSDMTFRDRYWLAGGGIEWKPWRHLRIVLESGAVLERRISVRSSGDDLDTTPVDTSPYLEVRFEIRP